MKLKAFICSVILLICFEAIAQAPDQKLSNIINKDDKGILVAAHRGDWRNTPENSVQALLNSIVKGFDIMELDVKMSKDSQLVVMHDNTINRTTNGTGKVSDFTLAELRQFRLKNGLGRVTSHRIPTLNEMMQLAKGKLIVNVDKGNKNLPQVFEVLKRTGTMEQAIVNVNENIPYEKLKLESNIPDEAYLMVVVNLKLPNALSVIESYKARKRSVIQPIFDTDTLSILKELPTIAENQVLWVNSLWPSLNGGHDDDLAVEGNKPEESWGWLIRMKASIIQTDRPVELLEYLKKEGKI